MRILFVYSDISGAERYGAKKYYSGLGSLSAVLKDAGHQVDLLYLQHEPTRDAFLAKVSANSPDLVGFSSTTHQFPFIKRYASYLREAQPNLLSLCGGVHPTLVPDQVIERGIFDIVCVGEGEYALRELAQCLDDGQDYSDVENLWVVRNGEITRNAMRPLIQDLDELPYVDRDLFGYDEILQSNDGWVDMMSGRGCPYDCSYCCNHAFKRRFRGLGQYVRFRSVEHVTGEIRALSRRYAIKTVNFQDDIFTLRQNWTLAFCRSYGREFRFPFWINARVERTLDEELIGALADAGCAGIRIGVENGDEQLRASVLKRQMSNSAIVATVRLAKQRGLKTYTCNMIGVPGETTQSIQATIDLNRDLAPDEFQFSVFYPYPMTELHNVCVEQGLIASETDVASYYAKDSALNLPTLTHQDLRRGYERFQALGDELALKRASPHKHRIYGLLLKLYRDDAPRMHRHLALLRGWRLRLRDLPRLFGRDWRKGHN